MSFSLFSSNRLELLVDDLAGVLDEPLPSPLEPEVIVVQSRGMERWLSMELAKRRGICANVRFPFPNSLVNEVFDCLAIAPAEEAASPSKPKPFDPENLTWRIMRFLPECLKEPAFASLKAYLVEPGAEVKRLQLALRVADLFHQYLLFRPEMILRWERGEESHWQAVLWRKLCRETAVWHRAALGEQLSHAIKEGKVRPASLPTRISVFGISALPEFHMQVFSAVSEFIKVNLFLMNPCREYWGDILAESEIRRVSKKIQKDDLTLDLFHFEQGNSLLASLGKLGRDFFDLIEEKFEYQDHYHFADPGQSSTLACVQSDILSLQEPRLADDPKRPVQSSDLSIQIHSCHSPGREIEVLQNNLLALFEKNADLPPSSVLVMAPDIEAYVPYIKGVFDLPNDHPHRIPFSIADRSFGRENSIIDAFTQILDFPRSRFTASEILNLLEVPAVSKKFGISASDLQLIRNWILETRIRWGQDATQRAKLGLPIVAANTWRAGLDRLLLGYALAGGGNELYDERILPYDHIEGRQAAAAGKLAEFMERLSEHTASLAEERRLSDWHGELNELLDTFFEPEDEEVAEAQVLRRRLAQLDELQRQSAFEERLSLPVINHFLKTRLQEEGYGYGFLSGGVTFCSMLPMRSIPARVLCLIGMNHDTYPRQTKRLGFDLMAERPRRGDRSRRNDDRYLFLEALLSARQVLYISYVGQSIRDNSTIPASVVVEELLDYLDRNFTRDGRSLSDHLVTRHALQAFNPKYFRRRTDLFSYSQENFEAAANLVRARAKPEAFFSKPLLEPDDGYKQVRLTDLYRFFRNPTQFLFNKRLNLFLREDSDVIPDDESFTLKGLDRYSIAKDLLQEKMAGRGGEHLKEIKVAAGDLPHGSIGDYQYEALYQHVDHFVEKTRNYVDDEMLQALDFELKLGDFTLLGKIDKIRQRLFAQYRFARVRAKDHLWVWLHHLALNACGATAYPTRSFLAGVDSLKTGNWQGWMLDPVPHCKEILSQLLQIYWQGLREPIRFFPEAALSFAKALHNRRKAESAIWLAKKSWEGSDMERGEREDLYFQRCFGSEREALNETFQELAQRIWLPILGHESELN